MEQPLMDVISDLWRAGQRANSGKEVIVPKVVRQSPIGSPSGNSTARAQPTTGGYVTIEGGEGIKLNTYGIGKVGKTRLAATFPKPLMLIGTENGTKSICTRKEEKEVLDCGAVVQRLFVGSRDTEIDFIRLDQQAWLEPLTDILKTGVYRTAVLDHSTGLQDIILKDVLGLAEIPVQKSWGLAQQSDWQAVAAQFKKRLRGLFDLADRIGLNVVITAHERDFKKETDNGEIIAPHIGSALSPAIAGWLNGECDYIAQAYIRQQMVKRTRTKVIGKESKEVVTEVPTGKVEYCLRIGASLTYHTGFRVPEGVELPDSLVNPHFDQIKSLIGGDMLE